MHHFVEIALKIHTFFSSMRKQKKNFLETKTFNLAGRTCVFTRIFRTRIVRKMVGDEGSFSVTKL